MSEISEALIGLGIEPGSQVRPRDRQPLQHTAAQAMCAMMFSVTWHSAAARHTDQLAACRLDLWRDLLPFELEPDLMGKPAGHVARYRYAPGELIVPYQSGLCFNLSQRAFHRELRAGMRIAPRTGRFYPRAFISGSRGIHAEEMLPFRVSKVSGDMLGCDLNNPLADRALDVRAQIIDIWSAGDDHPGSCNDIAEMLTRHGPGMQARWRGLGTDFWADRPFARPSETPDSAFYASPRLVPHVDCVASAQITRLYRDLLPAGGRVLDLMAGWQSHLGPDHGLGEVVGLGLNTDEMAANPALSTQLVHDLNREPELPFDDAGFDAVICSLSVEYLVRPFEVFAELARVLRPGGRLVVTFSNRWFAPKAIRLWEQLHEFERPGLVLEYFLNDGLFGELETWSMRGLPRPAGDPYSGVLAASDPVFAVWGSRR